MMDSMYVMGKNMKDILKRMAKHTMPRNFQVIRIALMMMRMSLKIKERTDLSTGESQSWRDYIAYVTNDWGRKRIWLYNQATGKEKSFSEKSHVLNRLLDKTYPVMAWHPSGKILTFINDEKADLVMYFYRVNEKEH